MSSQTSPSPKPPISPELAETFFEAVREYVRWIFGNPEPTVTFHQHPIPVSMVCRRVEDFTDPLPDEVFNAVCFLVMGPTERHLKEKLGAGRTYASAAQCLLKLIEGRQAEWREEWQRTQ
jgi:hypothetical protein